MGELFPGSTYDTPADTPRKFLDRLGLGSRWYFLAGYARIVLDARALALKGLYDDQAWIASSYRTLKFIEGCGGRFHLRGLDNIRALGGPAVFVSNHMSILETFVFPCLIEPYRHVTFVVKNSLVRGVFGPIMRSRDPIAVGRENPREDFAKVMAEGRRLLENGTSVVIFPQATRTVDFAPEKFNTLGIKLARAAGVEVVPVAIKTDFWENGRLFKDFGRIRRKRPIHMVFGRPFRVSGTGREDHERVIEFIAGHLREWGEEVKSGG